MVDPVSAEDAKLITLARAARARTRASDGAAVRDLDGRTYAAGRVEIGTLRLSAIDLAVAMAVSSGAAGLEAAAIVTEGDIPLDTDAVRAFAGAGVPVIVADPSGEIDDILSS